MDRPFAELGLDSLMAVRLRNALSLLNDIEPQILLPESDGIVYANLRPLHAFMHKNMKPASHDADYQSFIDATGIDWERDLEEAAMKLTLFANALLQHTAIAQIHQNGIM